MSSPKSVFITGASGGLGRGLALHYAREGATVHAAARRKDELEKLARESPNIVPVPLDVQDTGELVLALHRAEPLDMVIANAGIGQPTPARKIDWTAVKRIMDVNVTAATVTIAAALPAYPVRRQGRKTHVPSRLCLSGRPRHQVASLVGSRGGTRRHDRG